MNDKSFGGRMLAFLSSLRLAVVTMVTLGAVCGYATFYEMHNGTPAAQRDIYQTPWFAFILGLLGLNIFSVMVSRYPWTKHHIGFLTAHVGLLLLLVGSVVSLYRGLDSNMALFEGETSDRVALLEKALQVSVPGLGANGTFPVAFEKTPPAPGREKRFAVPGSDVVLVADEYQPHVSVVEAFEPAATGVPALHFLLQAPMATQEQWLVADDPQKSHLDLGMVSFGFHAASSDEQAQALLAQPEGANHLSFVAAPGGKLLFAAADASGTVKTGTVEPGQPVPTGWPAMGVTVSRFLPQARLVRTVKPEKPPAKEERRQSAVRLHLEGPKGKSEPEWVLWGERVRVAYGDQPASLAYRSPEAALPFKVTLLKFNNEPYPGLAHGLDLREHGARGGPGAGDVRGPRLDEPPLPPPGLHLLPVVVRRGAADDVDLLGGPRPGAAARLPRHHPHRRRHHLDVLRQALAREAPGGGGPRGPPRTGESE